MAASHLSSRDLYRGTLPPRCGGRLRRRYKLAASALAVWGVPRLAAVRGAAWVEAPYAVWADVVGCDRATLYRALARLERAGLIERRRQFVPGEFWAWSARQGRMVKYPRSQTYTLVRCTVRGLVYTSRRREPAPTADLTPDRRDPDLAARQARAARARAGAPAPPQAARAGPTAGAPGVPGMGAASEKGFVEALTRVAAIEDPRAWGRALCEVLD